MMHSSAAISAYMPRVLIVENDESCAESLRRALKIAEPINRQASSVRFDIDIVYDTASAVPFIESDEIDIYIVDLKFPIDDNPLNDDAKFGRQLVRDIQNATKAGIIIHSTEPAKIQDGKLDWLDADDYIEKAAGAGRQYAFKTKEKDDSFEYPNLKIPQVVRAKAEALWRRVQFTRPNLFTHFLHTNRCFQIGNWRFTVGTRDMSDDNGNRVRLSQTEHAFLRFLCTVEDHEITQEDFNASILGRNPFDKDSRMKNMRLRLQKKCGPTLNLQSVRGTGYKLLNVKEITSSKCSGS